MEIISNSQIYLRDFIEHYRNINELFRQEEDNILEPDSTGSFIIPLEGTGVYLSHILIMRGELGFEDPGISTDLEDLSFTVNAFDHCGISVEGDSFQTTNLIVASQPYPYCNATWFESDRMLFDEQDSIPNFYLGNILSSGTVQVDFNNHVDNNWQAMWVCPTPSCSTYYLWEPIISTFNLNFNNPIGAMYFRNEITTDLLCATIIVPNEPPVPVYGTIQHQTYLIFQADAPERYLEIEPNDSIFYEGELVKIKVTAMDSLGNEMTIDSSAQVLMTASPAGLFLGGDTIVTDYSTVHNDSVVLILPDSLPGSMDSLETTVYARLQDCHNIQGEQKITIKAIRNIDITLTIPSPEEIWPTLNNNPNNRNKKDNITVTVQKERTGTPVQNQEVNVSLEMILPSGGHDHTNQPTGSTILGGLFTGSSSANADTSLTILTDVNGTAAFNYIAGEAGCQMIIKARTVYNDSTYNVSDTLNICVPNLESLVTSNYYELVGAPDNHTGTNDPCRPNAPTSLHFDNHFATLDMRNAILNIATQYDSLHNSVVRLRINDISLEYGGLFDTGNNFENGHTEHRNGKQADIGFRGINSSGICVDLNLRHLLRLIRNNTNANPYTGHSDHYHIRVR